MSSRSKEKVAAVIRKFFKSSEKIETGEGAGGSGASGSPARRLRRGISPSPNSNGVTKPIDTTIRARRLMKEYKEIQRLQSLRPDPIFTVELINDNLYEWHARLHIVDSESKLAADMLELNVPHILLHLIFPENFPFSPPFMRVVEPRIEKGFVMEGGAICMELLTPRGWASAYTVEAVLMQYEFATAVYQLIHTYNQNCLDLLTRGRGKDVKKFDCLCESSEKQLKQIPAEISMPLTFAASLVKGQGRIARKVKNSKDFNRRSAEEAFRSLVKTHEKYGWVTPALSDG